MNSYQSTARILLLTIRIDIHKKFEKKMLCKHFAMLEQLTLLGIFLWVVVLNFKSIYILINELKRKELVQCLHTVLQILL